MSRIVTKLKGKIEKTRCEGDGDNFHCDTTILVTRDSCEGVNDGHPEPEAMCSSGGSKENVGRNGSTSTTSACLNDGNLQEMGGVKKEVKENGEKRDPKHDGNKRVRFDVNVNAEDSTRHGEKTSTESADNAARDSPPVMCAAFWKRVRKCLGRCVGSVVRFIGHGTLVAPPVLGTSSYGYTSGRTQQARYGNTYEDDRNQVSYGMFLF